MKKIIFSIILYSQIILPSNQQPKTSKDFLDNLKKITQNDSKPPVHANLNHLNNPTNSTSINHQNTLGGPAARPNLEKKTCWEKFKAGLCCCSDEPVARKK